MIFMFYNVMAIHRAWFKDEIWHTPSEATGVASMGLRSVSIGSRRNMRENIMIFRGRRRFLCCLAKIQH